MAKNSMGREKRESERERKVEIDCSIATTSTTTTTATKTKESRSTTNCGFTTACKCCEPNIGWLMIYDEGAYTCLHYCSHLNFLSLSIFLFTFQKLKNNFFNYYK